MACIFARADPATSRERRAGLACGVLAVAFVPHPPALVPELSGGKVPALEAVRFATTTAVERLLAPAPDRVCIVGSMPEPREYGGGQLAGSPVLDALAAYGGPGPRPAAPPGTLPLALAIGGWLLDRAGFVGTRTGLAGPAPAVDAEVLLVVGDGSARRDPEAPGTFDPAAVPFDDTVARALAAGDPAALAALDPEVGTRVLAAGTGAWRRVGELLTGRDVLADLTYYAAPFGVAYFVAHWTVR